LDPPDRALPDIGKGRGPVELFALIADIGRNILGGGFQDRLARSSSSAL
jgi:hypothetical protein